MKKIFSVESNGVTPPCPHCGGELKYRDSRPRIHCREGGTKEWIIIRRLKCHECGELHSELPDCLVPYKHYDSEIIAGVIDGIVTPDDADSEDYPCEETIKRWLQWYRENKERAEGYLRNTIYRLLDYKDDILKSGVPLLSAIKDLDVRPHWLGYILRAIYNSGGYLVPVW